MVVANAEKRRVVVVSQGTVQLDYSQLNIPTLTALADAEDAVIIAVLGKPGASFAGHIVDYIPFDDLLKHVRVFMTNGGYGGFQRSMSHGVPVIMSGATSDESEVAAQAGRGVGVNLRTDRPSTKKVRTVAREVLDNPQYKARAVEVEKEMYDMIQIIADAVEELGKTAKHTAVW